MADCEGGGSRLSALTGRAAVPPLAVALITLAVFAPTLGNGFVWDDRFNLVDNPHYRGLGWSALRWMLSTNWSRHPGWGGQWIPLTWLTLGLDYLAGGMRPLGYHLTNVALHAASAAVLFLVAARLLARALPRAGPGPVRLGAAAAALFFALHPLRVESVAWATERRDVLSGLLFLLTILTYLRACERDGGGRRRWLAASVAWYALALSAKAVVMSLPLVLLVLDAYPLGRLRGRWRERVVEKLPHVALAAAVAAIALEAVRFDSSLSPSAQYPLPARAAIALYSVAFYLAKTAFPIGLSPLHELPARVSPLSPPFLASALAVAAITAGAWLLRRRWPAGLAAWAAYLVMVAPMSGIVHAGFHLAADRYTYLPGLALALLVGGGVAAAAGAAATGALRPAYARLAAAAAAAWIAGLGLLTLGQIPAWADDETLWRWALEADPACAICHGNLGAALARERAFAPAIAHLERALALRPDYLGYERNLGLAFLDTGRPGDAVTHFRRALTGIPADPDLRDYLGIALLQTDRPAEAAEQFELALRLDPGHADARANLSRLRGVRPRGAGAS